MSKFVDLYGHDGHLLGKLCLETGRVQIGYLFYVPERTCRIKQHRCTNCDHEINDRAYFVKVEIGGGCWTADSRTANFCPNCGAKVAER